MSPANPVPKHQHLLLAKPSPPPPVRKNRPPTKPCLHPLPGHQARPPLLTTPQPSLRCLRSMPHEARECRYGPSRWHPRPSLTKHELSPHPPRSPLQIIHSPQPEQLPLARPSPALPRFPAQSSPEIPPPLPPPAATQSSTTFASPNHPIRASSTSSP